MAVFHPRARFDSYVEGVLSPVSRARIAAHLDECGDCRREVSQRERILQVASSVRTPHPTRPAPPMSAARGQGEAADLATAPVLETREGVAGWKVVAGMGALGLATVVVLSAAWIAGDPESLAGTGDAEHLLPAAASPAASSPVTEHDAGPTAAPGGSPAAEGAKGLQGLEGRVGLDGLEGASPTDPETTVDAGSRDEGGGHDPVLTPAGVDERASSSRGADEATGGISRHPGVALAGAVALTPDMVTDLRQHGWNVPSLNGFGLHSDSTGWALVGDTAEVIMSLRGDGASVILHECRSLAEDAGIPGCPLVEGLTGAGARATEVDVATQGETRQLPVDVEMSVLEHGDGTWTATTRTAHAAYTVESDLPVERADRVMSLVVISERSRVQSGTAPERPADRLARGFERLMPWMAEPDQERR